MSGDSAVTPRNLFSEACHVLSTEISVPEFELPPVDDSDRK